MIICTGQHPVYKNVFSLYDQRRQQRYDVNLATGKVYNLRFNERARSYSIELKSGSVYNQAIDVAKEYRSNLKKNLTD